MYDIDGRAYLDCLQQRARASATPTRASPRRSPVSRGVLNTNMRYLHASAIELAERLTASCPPSLDTVFFVNSGSEANDLAWRLATTFTGNSGGLCTTRAYHGISRRDRAVLAGDARPPNTGPTGSRRWAPTDTYRGLHADASSFRRRSTRSLRGASLRRWRSSTASCTSDGLRPRDPSLVQAWVRMTHDGRRPVDRRRGPGRPRSHRRGDVVVRAVRHRARLRHARQADGQRPPRGGGHHPPRDRRAVRRRHRVLQHVRRQPGVGRGGARRARRAARRARAARV